MTNTMYDSISTPSSQRRYIQSSVSRNQNENLKTEEYIKWSKERVKIHFPNVKFTNENFHGPNWYLNCQLQNISFEIQGDIGFGIVIRQNDMKTPLWKLNSKIEHIQKATKENIAEQVEILHDELIKLENRIINKLNGNINIAKNHFISPNKQIKQGIIDLLNPIIRDMKTGFIWYNFMNIEYKEQLINLSVCCFNNKVTAANVAPQNKEYIKKEGWDNWSKKKEMENLKYYNEWLDSEIGKNRYYSWGQIMAQFDNKSGFSSISVNYEKDKSD